MESADRTGTSTGRSERDRARLRAQREIVFQALFRLKRAKETFSYWHETLAVVSEITGLSVNSLTSVRTGWVDLVDEHITKLVASVAGAATEIPVELFGKRWRAHIDLDLSALPRATLKKPVKATLDDLDETARESLWTKRETVLRAIYRMKTGKRRVSDRGVLDAFIAKIVGGPSETMRSVRIATTSLTRPRLKALEQYVALGVPEGVVDEDDAEREERSLLDALAEPDAGGDGRTEDSGPVVIPVALLGPDWREHAELDLSRLRASEFEPEMTQIARDRAADVVETLKDCRRWLIAKLYCLHTKALMVRRIGTAEKWAAGFAGVNQSVFTMVILGDKDFTDAGLEKIVEMHRKAGLEELAALWGAQGPSHLEKVRELRAAESTDLLMTNRTGMDAKLRERLSEARIWYLQVAYRMLYRKKFPSVLTQVCAGVASKMKAKSEIFNSVCYGWSDLTGTQVKVLKEKLGANAEFHPPEVLGENWPAYLEAVLARKRETEEESGLPKG